MSVEQAPGKGARLKQREAQQHRVPHARPYGCRDAALHHDVLDQHRVNRHADDDEEALKPQRQQASEVILAHLPPFPVGHGRHGDGSDGGHAVDFDHPAVADDENADGQRPHGKMHDHGLQPQPQQRPDLHFRKRCFKSRDMLVKRQGRVRYDDARRAVDDALSSFEHAHDDVPGVGDDEHGAGGFEYPLEEHPSVHVVHVVLFRNELNQLQRHDKCEDHAGDGQNHIVRQRSDHAVDAAVPALGRSAHLSGDARHAAVHVVKQSVHVVHDAADQQLLQPFGEFLPYQIQWALPSFPAAPAPRGGRREGFVRAINRTGRRAGERE